MNASAYLKGQGWRGEGFSLDTSDRGLTKHLLVQHKVDLAGLGTRKNDFGNQWWLNAFDKSLKSIGYTPEVIEPSEQKSPFRPTALYSTFVKAETLSSTISKASGSESTTPRATSPEQRASQMAPSMSTVPAGFILGEPQSISTSASIAPVEAKKEKHGKKRKHVSESDGVPAPPVPLDEVEIKKEHEKEKKSKKRKHNDNAVAEETASIQPPFSSAVAPEVAKDKKIKKSKRSVLSDAVASAAEGVSVPASAEALSEVNKEKKNKKRKLDQDANANAAKEVAPSTPSGESPVPKTGKKEKRSKEKHKLEEAHATTSVTKAAPAAEPVAAPQPMMETPQFISLEDPKENGINEKLRKKGKQKHAGDGAVTTAQSPVVTNAALEAANTPTWAPPSIVHPSRRAQVPTSKPAAPTAGGPMAQTNLDAANPAPPPVKRVEKRIEKKGKKMSAREELRVKRKAKKADKARANVAKKERMAAYAASKPKKSEKYARQKALRVAKREARERMEGLTRGGAGGGAAGGVNGIPVAGGRE